MPWNWVADATVLGPETKTKAHAATAERPTTCRPTRCAVDRLEGRRVVTGAGAAAALADTVVEPGRAAVAVVR
ncbi:hypothetical protein GCM10010988_35510 [Cnuibacter physcomitrellae]|nr:hypothetical protein GCM10010988_35510 [Cnuibacter physcomitrellae]